MYLQILKPSRFPNCCRISSYIYNIFIFGRSQGLSNPCSKQLRKHGETHSWGAWSESTLQLFSEAAPTASCTKLGGKILGGFKYFLFSPRILGKIPILSNIFQMGWNHQLHLSEQTWRLKWCQNGLFDYCLKGDMVDFNCHASAPNKGNSTHKNIASHRMVSR